jgi:hypothetical protein
MNKININVALVRLLQFVVFVVFTFIVMTYFGALLLIPLDLILIIIKILGAIGLHGILAAAVAVPAVGYLGLVVYQTPGLIKLLIDTGMDLVNAGKKRIEAFNTIADQLKEKVAAKA